MDNSSYQNFKSAITDFKAIIDNVSEICENRTVQYSSVGSLAGTILGGLAGALVKSDDDGNGNLIGSLAGLLVGGVLGGAIAGRKNRKEKKSCADEIEEALSQWRRAELPIVEAFLEAYDRTLSTFDLEVQYYIDSSSVLNNVIMLTDDDIKNNAELLRRCIASRFRMLLDIDESRKIISYMNSYSEYLDDLDAFKKWQSNLFRTQWWSFYNKAYSDICKKTDEAFSIVQKSNFKKVLRYIPLFRAGENDRRKMYKEELSLPPLDIASRSLDETQSSAGEHNDELSDDELELLAESGNLQT